MKIFQVVRASIITEAGCKFRRRNSMKYKLLVAEDISSERAALCSTLARRLDHRVTILEAQNGAEALALFYEAAPDIAILNIEMPVFSGLEVAQKIRESNIPCALLFISDYDSFSYVRQAIALRALDYILKPWDEEKLILSVQDAMEVVSQNVPVSRDVTSYSDLAPKSDVEDIRLSLVRQDIHNFIEEHYKEELSMKNVARAMNYSDAYFCKLFKQCFQTNFSSFLNEYRVDRAKDMLASTRLTIKEIGDSCGYSDPNYFSRVFKRITGQSPTEYRLSIIEKSHKY